MSNQRGWLFLLQLAILCFTRAICLEQFKTVAAVTAVIRTQFMVAVPSVTYRAPEIHRLSAEVSHKITSCIRGSVSIWQLLSFIHYNNWLEIDLIIECEYQFVELSLQIRVGAMMKTNNLIYLGVITVAYIVYLMFEMLTLLVFLSEPAIQKYWVSFPSELKGPHARGPRNNLPFEGRQIDRCCEFTELVISGSVALVWVNTIQGWNWHVWTVVVCSSKHDLWWNSFFFN